MSNTHYIYLTEDELVAIQDKVITPKTKELIEEIVRVRALQDNDSPTSRFIASIVELAGREGRLSFTIQVELRKCPICSNEGTYYRYRSSGRYHRKGEENLDKPIYLRGVDLQHSFIRMRGYAKYGCCLKCWEEIKPKLVERLADIKAEIPKAITGVEPKWEYTHWVKCNSCQWEGWQAQLGKLPTIMSGGDYYGRCPQCKEKELIFTKQFTHTHDKWTVLERIVA